MKLTHIGKATFLSALSILLITSSASAAPQSTYSVYTGTYSGIHDSGAVTIYIASNGAVLCTFDSSSAQSPLIDPYVMTNAIATGASINDGFAGIGFSCANTVSPLTFGHQLPLFAAVGSQPFPPTGTFPNISFSGTWFNAQGDRGTFQATHPQVATDTH